MLSLSSITCLYKTYSRHHVGLNVAHANLASIARQSRQNNRCSHTRKRGIVDKNGSNFTVCIHKVTIPMVKKG